MQSNVSAYLKELEAKLSVAAEVIGGKAEGFAKLLCRVDTGRLRNSITHGIPGQTLNFKYTDDNGNPAGEYNGAIPLDPSGKKFVVTIGSNVEYAPYIELGSKRRKKNGETIVRPPRPFLRPAIENHREEYKAVLKQILSEK